MKRSKKKKQKVNPDERLEIDPTVKPTSGQVAFIALGLRAMETNVAGRLDHRETEFCRIASVWLAQLAQRLFEEEKAAYIESKTT